MTTLANLLPDLVTLERGQPVTTSLKVAKYFHKRHDNVIRAIRSRIAEAGEWGLLNFEETYQEVAGPNNSVRREPVFTMTKNGFTFLVQKFTGKKAVGFQISYIEQFDAMEGQLRRRDQTISQRLQDLIATEVESEVRAHFGSILLHERKRELPLLRGERQRLEQEIQPALFGEVSHAQ